MVGFQSTSIVLDVFSKQLPSKTTSEEIKILLLEKLLPGKTRTRSGRWYLFVQKSGERTAMRSASYTRFTRGLADMAPDSMINKKEFQPQRQLEWYDEWKLRKMSCVKLARRG